MRVTEGIQGLGLKQPDEVTLQRYVSMNVVATFGNGVVLDGSVRVAGLVVRSQEVTQRKMATHVV